jgi:hypothetical protein
MAELGVLLIGAACVLVALAVMPTLIELRRTIVEITSMLAMLNAEFVPLLREMRAVCDRLAILAPMTPGAARSASPGCWRGSAVGHTVRRAHDILEHHPLISSAFVWSAGIRAAATVFRNRMPRRSPTNGRGVSEWKR